MITEESNLIWPETTIFWGAGATAHLGFPTTAELGKHIREWASCKNRSEVETKLESRKWSQGAKDNIVDLLTVLGLGSPVRIAEYTEEQVRVLRRVLPKIDKKRQLDLLVLLRIEYDWDALQRVVKILPSEGDGAQFLCDLFNILDMHIISRLSFNVKCIHEEGQAPGLRKLETLSQVRLIGARNCLVLLINMMLQGAYLDLVSNRPEELQPYKRFADTLAKLMQEEGVRFIQDHQYPRDTRAAYLFSYAIVSMNFDPLLLWLLFNAHKDANDSSPPYVGSPCQPLKLFNDFGHFMGARRIPVGDDNSSSIWYPSNETVMQRINDKEHCSGRIGRVGKFYFPHGCFCWRECPSCGKLYMHLGDEWNFKSPTLFPPVPLQTANVSKARSQEEKRMRDKGRTESVLCGYCGAVTHASNTPVIMQTSFKGDLPPFLEEIARDMRPCLENTRHFVFLGYSLPSDDVIYRALFSSRSGGKPFCSVVVGFKGEQCWIKGEQDLKQYCEMHKDDDAAAWGTPTIKAACEIFGYDKVRAFTGGIPRIFEYSVRELLYPTTCDIDVFTADGVVRKTTPPFNP